LRRAIVLGYPWTMLARSVALGLGLCSLTALAAGCGNGGGGGDGALGEAQEASVCAAGTVVYGVDVSVYQGTVNWPDVKAAGDDFAIARISDGTSVDGTFATNWAGMKSAGLVRGAYQYFEPGDDPTAQANVVIQAVGVLGAGDLPVTADMETTGGQSGATIAANLQTWVTKVTAGTGKAPMVYTAPGYWDSDVGSAAFGKLPLWAADWGVTCPTLSTGWSNWDFWQYADSGTVNGISGGVDHDEFNGDLAALQTFAGGAPDWGAQYVTQSWPPATTTMTMTVNQALPASITLKNIGTSTWNTSTRIGTTQPRDRTSPFAGADWIAPNRPAGVTGTVAPGADFDFKFTFYAPDTPGLYDEFYGVVQEGVAWFSDPGQGGPPDNDIEAKIQVNEAEYHGQFVSQTYPTLQQPAIMMTVGQTLSGSIELKNVGTSTWKAGVTKLAPTPRDMASVLAASSWLSTTRVSTPAADVAPGQSFSFPLELHAAATGSVTQTFSLVEEGVTWFGDAPLGGGPPDNLLAVHVVVTDGAGGGSSTGTGTGGETSTGSTGGEGTGGAPHAGTPGARGGCSCRTAGAPDGGAGGAGAVLLAIAGALVAVRRRSLMLRSGARPMRGRSAPPCGGAPSSRSGGRGARRRGLRPRGRGLVAARARGLARRAWRGPFARGR
jgi:lysozyme